METVGREAHGISNALLEIQAESSDCYRYFTDPNGPLVFVAGLVRSVAFPSSVRQQLLGPSDKPCKKIAGFG